MVWRCDALATALPPAFHRGPRSLLVLSRVVVSSLILMASSSDAADESDLVVPQLKRPVNPATERDPLQEKYDAAWTNYEQTVSRVTAEVTACLDAQFEKAADAGDLDLADMWDRKKKAFAETLILGWPTDSRARGEWRKTYPNSDFPEGLSEIVEKSRQAYITAIETLKNNYASLVGEYTKARNLERARQLRSESTALALPEEKPQRPKMDQQKPEENSERKAERKPERKRAGPRTAQELRVALAGTKWKNQNGFTFEWDMDGNVWHCKDEHRTPLQVQYLGPNKCTIMFITNVTHVLVFNQDWSAFEQRGMDGEVKQTAIRLK